MARFLNKDRMLQSKNSILVAIIVVLFTRQFFKEDTFLHEFFEFFGLGLTAFCALGRLYTTAFLGGFKNKTLITYGPFSLVRHPLYFFSLIGITGISLISNHIVVMVGLPLLFLMTYLFLIRREESFLESEFGADYIKYKNTTPRLFPRFSLYQAPETTPMYPKFMNKAFLDAMWWFIPFPIIELVEYIQDVGWITPYFKS